MKILDLLSMQIAENPKMKRALFSKLAGLYPETPFILIRSTDAENPISLHKQDPDELMDRLKNQCGELYKENKKLKAELNALISANQNKTLSDFND